MDTYQQIRNLFSQITTLSTWDEIHAVFDQISANKPFHWTLPTIACEAVGGTAEQSIPTALAVACSHISIILVDDMLDSDPRGKHQHIGMPAVANIACTFQAAALAAISLCHVKAATKISMHTCLNEMMLSTTLGQYLDTLSPTDEAAYWHLVRTKSSPFFGASLQLGALAGGCSEKIAKRLLELGCLYGEMIQIHDDLNDVMDQPANPDWTEQRSPLPILFAQLVDHPRRARFLELRRRITSPGALEEAQSILIQVGAVSYCVDQILRRYQEARRILDDTPLPRRGILEDLIEKVIAPVQRLFHSIDKLPVTKRKM